MTTKLSDDGRRYWDGSQWQSAISADGRWRWDGRAWVANAHSNAAAWHKTFRIGSWVGAGIAGLLLLIFLLAVVVSLSEWSQGSLDAPSSFGAALIILSTATLLVSPLALRIAVRRGMILAASLGAGVLFLGSCGSGIALTAAFPPPATPGRVAQATLGPSQSPRIPDVGPASASPETASPSAKSSPTPTPSPSPSPSLSPVVPTPSPSPAPPPPPPPPPSPVASTCGAPSNPWGYNFCGRGGYIYQPPSTFCTYFAPCVSTFWTATSGYVVQCASGSWSHSGGVSGACSRNGGVAGVLYSGP
jgi:hypothetical protein